MKFLKIRIINLNSENKKIKNLSSDFSSSIDTFYKFFHKRLKYLNRFYYYSYFTRSRKVFLKTRNGRILNRSFDAKRRDKNNNVTEQFINVSFKNGKKITFLKHLNTALKNLYFSFNSNGYHDLFQHFNELNHRFDENKLKEFIELVQTDMNYYFNLSNVLADTMVQFFPIFNVKLNKSINKKKSSNKNDIDIIYIKPDKRLKFTLKLFNLFTEKFDLTLLSDRILAAFICLFIDSKNTFL